MSEATSTTANRTLRRLSNATYRPREYLTEAEVERLIETARKRGRNGARDAAAILLTYRQGLRAGNATRRNVHLYGCYVRFRQNCPRRRGV